MTTPRVVECTSIMLDPQCEKEPLAQAGPWAYCLALAYSLYP